MFKRIATAALLSCLSLPAAALCTGGSYLDQLTAAQNAQLIEAVATIPFAEGVIWDARKGNDTIKVVGTMHIYDPRLESVFAAVADAVHNADLVLVEATPEDEAALQRLVTSDPSQIFLTSGPTLPELLDEETWQLLSEAASARQIPSFMAAKMQPWYLSIVLAVPPCAMTDMLAGNQGLDHMITGAAAETGVPMQALEDFRLLFSIFQDEPLEQQLEVLRMNLLMPDMQEAMFVAMLDAYFSQDIATLLELSRIALSDLPNMDVTAAMALFDETQTELLDNRNRNWIPVITEALATHDDIVVAVGAAHLVGENGILNLLQDDGWAISRAD